jgi:hypothetical protein
MLGHNPLDLNYTKKFKKEKSFQHQSPHRIHLDNKNPRLTHSFMARKRSSFEGDSYRGYKVSIRLVKENLADYEPVRMSNPGDVYAFMSDFKHSDRERFYSLLHRASPQKTRTTRNSKTL